MNHCRRYGWTLTMALGVSAGMGVVVGCGGDARDLDRTTSAALISTSTANVRLQELTNSCGANQAQDFFKVVNAGATPIPASDVSIKIWVDDTSGSDIVPRIDTGGCLLDAFGSCVHQVTGVTATATRFTPACGPDDHHQANWEITIRTTDHAAIGAGLVWSNIQLALHLANFSSFSPGTARWYSECLSGTGFAHVAHAAVYVQGNLVTASSGVPPSCRAPTGMQSIPGELPPAVASGAMPLVGPLPGNTPVHLLIGLPVQKQADLQTLIEQVYDPRSPQYRKFLTPDEFGASFGASPDAYNDLISFAQLNGLTVVSRFAGRTVLAVTGPASAVEKAFFVTLNEYRRPDDSTFYAPANEPSANLAVPVLHVNGFDNFAIPKPAQGHGLGSCPPNSTNYGGADFRTAYLHDLSAADLASLDGDGQTVALIEFEGYTPGTPEAYASAFKLSPIPTISKRVVPLGEVAPDPGQHEAEVALDIEMVMAMAPKAKIVVYEEDMSKHDPAAMLALLAEDRVPIISNSWTWPHGASDKLTPIIFQQLAVQGQSFIQASGDAGAYSAEVGSAEPNVPEPIILSSLMTVVGGTILTTDASTVLSSETAWTRFPTSNQATGGGFCNGYTDPKSNVVYPTLPLPSYQLGINQSNTEVTTNPSQARMIPDVSMIADQIAVFAHAFGAPKDEISLLPCHGGTSGATPLWAGLIALINQHSIKGGGKVVGFANPTLYALAADKASYGANFNDVLTGKNSLTALATVPYHATAGYDLATGLGSPRGNLIHTLPPQSCMPGASLTVLISGSNVTAYVPNGSWIELKPGVNVVPIEGTVSARPIATPLPVNTCGGDSATGKVVCTSNDTDVYIIDGAKMTTIQSGATGEQTFSGGTCKTCNVAIDPLRGQALLSIGTPDGAALRSLDLRTLTLGTPIALGQKTSSEDIAIDAVRGLALSPNEGEENSGGAGNYQLVNLASGAVFNFNPPGGDPAQFGFDMAAEDCSTGIALATNEFTNQLFLTDLTQATFTDAGTWSAPFKFQSVDAFSTFGAGTNAIAVASNSHLGVVSGEFGTATFGVFVLPSTSGSGGAAPALVDWVAASLPSTPDDNLPWLMGLDPHTLTAYTSPGASGKQYAVFADDQFDQKGNRTFLAIVDMQALLDLPRINDALPHPNDSDGHTVKDPLVTCKGTGPPVSPCVVRYIKISN